MIVYLITAGTYSDYSVYSVSLDEKDARQQAERLRAIIHDRVDVETRETDLLKNIMSGTLSSYDFVFDYETGELVRNASSNIADGQWIVQECASDYNSKSVRSNDKNNRFFTTVYASDYDTARKIATDRLAEFKAQKAGIV